MMRGMASLLVCAFVVTACEGASTPSADAATDTPVTDTPVTDTPVTDAPAPQGTLVDEAIATCVWTTACLNTEDSFGGAAPNTNVGSCLGTFLSQHMGPGGLEEPWDEFRACVAARPANCEAFRQCLLARNAICALPPRPGSPPDWIEGGLCPDGTRSCTSPACAPMACAAAGQTCNADGSRLQRCMSGLSRSVPCGRQGAPGRCVAPDPSAALCIPGTVGTCTGAASLTCDGAAMVMCNQGIQARFDCAALGETCGPMGCTRGTECTYMDDGCMGNTLRTCFNGRRRTVDCAALGGTCGTVRGAREACVLPNGA